MTVTSPNGWQGHQSRPVMTRFDEMHDMVAARQAFAQVRWEFVTA